MSDYKKPSLDVLLTKLSAIYKDAYIIENKYCIGGPDSKEEIVYNPFIIFEDNCLSALSELNSSNSNTIFVSSMRKVKKDINEYTRFDMSESDESFIDYNLNKTKNIVENISVWYPFNVSDEIISQLFDDGISVEFDLTSLEYPNVMINKKMLNPVRLAKNIGNIRFGVSHDKDNVYNFILKIDTDYFTVYNVSKFMDMKTSEV